MSDDSNTDKKSETKPNPENSTEDKSIDKLKEELGKASGKIETMEKKIADQEKTTASIKRYKSEGTLLDQLWKTLKIKGKETAKRGPFSESDFDDGKLF